MRTCGRHRHRRELRDRRQRGERRQTADGSVKDLFLAAGTFVADSAGRRPLLQSAAGVNAVHASITDTAVTVWLDDKSALNLRLYAPQATPSMGACRDGTPPPPPRDGT